MLSADEIWRNKHHITMKPILLRRTTFNPHKLTAKKDKSKTNKSENSIQLSVASLEWHLRRFIVIH